MTNPSARSGQSVFTRAALGCGIAAPCLYFGTQLVAAASYPGYNWLRQSASQLGSDTAQHPAVFNNGAILIGIATLFASWGFLRGLSDTGSSRVIAWLMAVVIAVSALMDFWAGVFPMPNPRHGQNPFQIAAIAAPVLIGAVVWRGSGAAVRVYFVVSVVAIVALLTNVFPIDRELYDGLFQRLLALAVFPPVGVGSYVLLRRLPR